MTTSALLPRMIGEYRVTGFLGAGGMGEVYQAVHSRLGRVVAAKVLTKADRGERFVERFQNEARIQARLHHPHIATLYDFFEYEGRPCIIMEYVDGQELAARVREAGGLPVAEALAIFRAVVDAIAYVHRHGIVHRDVKANNVKISATGEVKLLDFGIARTPDTPGLTRAGAVIGTPEYLSPEQLHGCKADARSDIWALGILLYEMLTGRVPFEAPSLVDLYRRIDEADYPSPAALGVPLPDDVQALVTGCLQRRPADRFASAEQLLQRVDQCLAATASPARLSSPAVRGRLPDLTRVRAALASSWKPVTLGVAAFLLAVLGVYAISQFDPTNPVREDPSSNIARPGPGPLHRVTIDVVGAAADVYQGDRWLAQTPYRMEARVGETVELTLRRDGSQDKVVRFDVTPTKSTYTEVLRPRYPRRR